MLKLHMMPQDPEAYEIVTSFVNERLISLMEEIMLDEVAWDMAARGELDDDAMDKDFEDLVDIQALMNDRDFAENALIEYLPDNFPIERANQVFFGLYKLLNADEEYVPEPPMAHLLYRIIYAEVAEAEMLRQDTEDGLFDDLFDDPMFDGMEDDDISTVIPIPEPERSIVEEALYNEFQGNYEGEELDDLVEFLLNTYEDLNEYDIVCFEDTELEFLDARNRAEMSKSLMNERIRNAQNPNPQAGNAQQKDNAQQRKPKIIQFPGIDPSGKKD